MALDHKPVSDAQSWLLRHPPRDPVCLYAPAQLQTTARLFLDGFPGLVSYAVKANPDPMILADLRAAGIRAWDVASPAEMQAVRQIDPEGALHYHNPIRSRFEIAAARQFGIESWSIDRLSELDKLGDITDQEIAIRLRLDVSGAAYDFGAKFGAAPAEATALLRQVTARGGLPSMTFHPGTQCADPTAWARYITACRDVARAAGCPLRRLNVGGGFPSHRAGQAPDLTRHFRTISEASRAAFGPAAPALVCEPGRAIVAEAVSLALQIKAATPDAIYLNDGIYGTLAEFRDVAPIRRITLLSPTAQPRQGPPRNRRVFGPTCDSLDCLPDPLPLPSDLQEGDTVLIRGMGAYSTALATGFNGYGTSRLTPLR